jgi:site-specific DNA-methyltransferase (adenine-specific)
MNRIETLADGITLYLGDCREILPTLGNVDAVITDPPFEEEAHTLQRRVYRCVNELLPFAAITSDLRVTVAAQIVQICNGWMLAFCQAEAVAEWRDVFESAGAAYKRSMVWIKPDGMPQYSGDRPGMGYESIVAVWCGQGKSIWNGGGRHGVFTFNKNGNGGQRNPHPTTKPIGLMQELVALFTRPADLICDPFMGSGTTGVAAAKYGRRFVGVEIDPGYFDMACHRISETLKQPDLFIERPAPPAQLEWFKMWSRPFGLTASEQAEVDGTGGTGG